MSSSGIQSIIVRGERGFCIREKSNMWQSENVNLLSSLFLQWRNWVKGFKWASLHKLNDDTLQPTQFIQQSNEASRERTKMNSSKHNSNMQPYILLSIRKKGRKYERMHLYTRINIGAKRRSVKPFSDRWLSALLCIFVQIFDLHIGNNQLKKRRHVRSVHQSRCLNTRRNCFVADCFSVWLHVWVISHIQTWVGGICFSFWLFWLEAFPILSLVDFHHLHVTEMYWLRTNKLNRH